jgi:hypothetical protein
MSKLVWTSDFYGVYFWTKLFKFSCDFIDWWITFNYVPTLLVAELIPGTMIDEEIFEWEDFYELSDLEPDDLLLLLLSLLSLST